MITICLNRSTDDCKLSADFITVFVFIFTNIYIKRVVGATAVVLIARVIEGTLNLTIEASSSLIIFVS